MRQAAVRSALSALARDQQLIFVDSISIDVPKTSAMRAILDTVAGKGVKTLVLLADRNDNVEQSIQNLDNAHYLRASYLNMRDLLQYDRVIVPLAALDVIKSIWGTEGK